MSFACEFFSVSDAEEQRFELAYPAVNVQQEFQKMETWLWANPSRRKKKYKRFIVNWLSKTHGRLMEAEVKATVREVLQREQRHVDAMVGKYNPLALTPEQAERDKREIAEILKRHPDLA